MWWVCRWLLILAAFTLDTIALPVPDEAVDTSTKVLGSSVVTSVSVLMGHEDGNSGDGESDRREVTDDLPASTVDMLKPDGFQFYTVDEKGQLITRQMTDSEIQSIIAATGGPLPIGGFDNEKTGENGSGETKVADVVQNVQNVLKEELNKPPTAMGIVPTIPGHASAEWSSILPSILGGDTESAPVSLPESDKPDLPVTPVIPYVKEDVKVPETPSINDEEAALLTPTAEFEPAKENVGTIGNGRPGSSADKEVVEKPVVEDLKPVEKPDEDEGTVSMIEGKPTVEEETGEGDERPMIQVPVITADSFHSTIKNSSSDGNESPIYQILNTISADEVKNQNSQTSTEKTSAVASAEKEDDEKKIEESVLGSMDEQPPMEVTEKEKPATMPDRTEVEIASGLAAKPEKEADKPTDTSSVKGESVPGSADGKPAIVVVAGEEEPARIPPDTAEVETASSVAAKPEKEADASTNSSPLKDAEKTGLDGSGEKQEVPSVVQEIPSMSSDAPGVIGEMPVANSVAEEIEKPAEDGQEKKPSVENDETDQSLTPIEATTEKESLTETMKEKVSEIINMFPGSINSIVEELISESTSKAPEKLADKGVVENSESVTTSSETKPAVLGTVASENTKVKEKEEEEKGGEAEEKIKEAESSNRVEKPAVSTTEEAKISDEKISSVIPASQTPIKTETEGEPISGMLPEIIADSTDVSNSQKTTSEVAVAPLEKVESKPDVATAIVPEPSTSVEKVEQQFGTTTKIADSQDGVTQSLIPVEVSAAPVQTRPVSQAPVASTSTAENDASGGSEAGNDSELKTPQATVENEKPVVTEDKKTETLLTELADSVSSMISQVSEVLPSMVPIPQKSEDDDQSVKRVEDRVKPEITTVTSDLPKPEAAPQTEKVESVATGTSGETSAVISTNKVELPEAPKPEKTESETQTVTVEKAEPTEAESVDNSETIEISEPVTTGAGLKGETRKPEIPVEVERPAAVVTESGSTEAITEVDTPELEAPSAPAISENDKIEEVGITEMDSEAKPQKPEADLKNENMVPQLAEDLKPQAVKDETKIETPEPSGSSESEAPIVRIDITEAKPTEVSLSAATSTDISDVSTEFPVVRIQMTNPVATINQMIDAASVQTSSVDVEALKLPEEKIDGTTAQNIGSNLIAGPQPENPAGIKPSKESSSPLSGVNRISENAIPTANTDPDKEITSSTDEVASDAGTVAEHDEETKETKIPESEVVETANESKPTPETAEEGNVKSPAPETETEKIGEEPNNPKPAVEEQNGTPSPSEQVQETKVPAPVTTKLEVPVEPVVRVDLPVPNEKIEVPEKLEEPVATDGEKIIEPSTAVDEKKEAVASTEAPSKIPSEVVVSTTVDVLAEKIPESTSDKNSAKTPLPEEKPDSNAEASEDSTASESVGELDSETAVTAEKTEDKPEASEAENTATKLTDIPAPATTQSDAETNSQVVTVSTEESGIGEKDELDEKESDNETTESLSSPQSEIKTPDSKDAVTVRSPEVVEKESGVPVVKNDVTPVTVESSDVKGSENSVSEPSIVPVSEIEPPLSVEKPENKIPVDASPAQVDLKKTEVIEIKPEESSDSTADKDRTSSKPVAPVVRIDMSPETSMALDASMDTPVTEKPSEEPVNVATDSEKPSDNEQKVVASGTKIPTSEDKLPEKSEAIPGAETTAVQSTEPETTGALGSSTSSVAPVKSEIDSNQQEVKKDEAQPPAAKEPEASVLETPQDKVKETIGNVDSELPVTTATPTAPISATKIESADSAKPVIKIEESAPGKTQEIRIQVNETAVLVTKHPIAQEASKVSENGDKKSELENSPAQTMDKIEVPSQSVKPAKESSDAELEEAKKEGLEKKPQVQSVGKGEEVSKISVQNVSPGLKKKPLTDPYVKLGEKQEDTGMKKPSLPTKNKDSQGSKLTEDKWTLIPQSEASPVVKPQAQPTSEVLAAPVNKNEEELQHVSVPLDAHQSSVSLAESTRNLDKDIEAFSSLCNELAFSFWTATNKGLSTARSLALSPFGMTSMLAMVFLGARGPTSGQMNDILKLDDVVTFNPHLVFQNVSDSVNLARGQGIANAAFVRELFADRSKAGRLLPFYKERAQQFYDGHVEEVNFATISDLVRRRTNLLIRRQTGGRIRDFVRGNVMPLRSPLAALSANVFQTDCAAASSEGRDGEMYFAVLPAVRQRKLVPVPATVWKSGVLAGYEPGLDATVISLGSVDSLVSTIFLLPGQQGLAAPGDSLDHLERRLLDGAFTQGVWDRLLKTLIPRMGLEVQVPKFSHRSIVNATAALKRMGLEDLFSKHADLKGINGVGNDLHLADMLQINLFSTCGDESITGGRHHIEIYPASPIRGARASKNVDEVREEKEEEPELSDEKEVRSRRSVDVVEYVQQSRDAERSVSPSAEKELQRSSFGSKAGSKQESKGKESGSPLLKLDRPFLYFVRHNPTGMILHMGRFNPRLMP